jgi:hypothetical protein
MSLSTSTRPQTLAELRSSGWQSKTVKQEIHESFLAKLTGGDELYPGIVGYDDTVIPELNIAILAQHNMLFLGNPGTPSLKELWCQVPLVCHRVRSAILDAPSVFFCRS